MKMNWHVGDDLGLKLDQVSDEETRDIETLERMLAEINQVAAGYGFKIRGWNRWPDFRAAADGEVRNWARRPNFRRAAADEEARND